MTSVKSKLFLPEISPLFSLIILFCLLATLSGCSTYIASKQDDILTQIDVWSSENEFGKALETINYVKKSHPQYNNLQARKKSLLIEANDYQQKIHSKTVQLIRDRRWAEALDLVDEAKAKYPQGKQIPETEKFLFSEQQQQLALIDQKIMLERSQWMILTRPIYQSKLETDPRNKALKTYVDELNAESETLAQKLTQLSQQAIKDKHFLTAQTRIDQAISLAPSPERQKIASRLKYRAKTKNKKKQLAQKRTYKKKQYSILLDIEKSFKAGDLLKTRRLISSLDNSERNNPELIQLEQELDRSINYTIQNYFSEANKLYTDGQFHDAIALWQQVLKYEPDNVIAKKNIVRAKKVIKKLSTLREKQQN